MKGRQRNTSCPCGNGSKAKKCCLQPDGTWFKKPAEVSVPAPKTGYANPNCYLQSLNNCSKKTSREHYVPEAILESLNEKAGSLEVSGVPWIEPGETQHLPPNALAAKVLCKRHNEGLSALDTEALRFFNAVRELRIQSKAGQQLVLFNGTDIERWMLKTTLGILWAGIARVKPGQPIRDLRMGQSTVRLLLHCEEWRAEAGLGLYFLLNKDKTVVERDQVAFRPVVNTKKNEIIGGELAFRGLEFIIGTSPEIRQYSAMNRALYRPYSFSSGRHEAKREILFSWNDGRPHRPVFLTFTGERKCR